MSDEQGERWDELWRLQYDLNIEIDALVDKVFANHPPMWKAMAMANIVEHLAERCRFDIDLPAATSEQSDTPIDAQEPSDSGDREGSE